MAPICIVICLKLMGCLVIDTVESEFGPPSIESAPDAEFPLHDFIVIDSRTSTLTEIDLETNVRDASGAELEWQLILDGVTRQNSGTEPAGDSVRPLTARLSLLNLPIGCHSLELRVTHEFDIGSFEPVDPNDLGTTVWWIAHLSDLVPTIDPEACESSGQ